MRAWAVERPGPIDTHPLQRVDRPDPEPGPGEVRVRVSTCGVCRTDLHLAEGDLPPHRPNTIPGHEIVGVVDMAGAGATRFALGQRIGIAWLRQTCGVCRFCRRGDENLCSSPRFTGWDDDGGYAEYAVVDEAYAYALPDAFDDQQAAPLLCAGIIGFRALRRANLPADRAATLGIYGFGASAHIAAQLALFQGATVHVFTRSMGARSLALELGAASASGAADPPPEPLDGAILFAPAGELVPVALEALDRGGTMSISGIHLTDVPVLNYDRDLFEERTLTSVTANTRADGEAFLDLAARIPVRLATQPYPLEEADRALADLAADRVTGAAVLRVGAGA
jgi:propanol-preferring alcohol dehydrogenase